MQNETFQNANQVFKGKLHRDKQDGLDTSHSKKEMTKADLEKLYNNYLIPGLHHGDTEILLHKVFFDIMYFTGRHGKEGLKSFNKKSGNHLK